MTEHHFPHLHHHTPTDDITEAEDTAGFDLDTDVSQPHLQPGAPAFDSNRDLAFGPEDEH